MEALFGSIEAAPGRVWPGAVDPSGMAVVRSEKVWTDPHLLAPAHYLAHLARACEQLEIQSLDPVRLGGVLVEPHKVLEKPQVERLLGLARKGGALPRLRVEPSLRGRQVVERTRTMLKRQSDVRQLHEKAGFEPAWEELEKRIEVPDALGALLAVVATVRPVLFGQGLLGGYLAAMLAWELRMPVQERVAAFLAGLCRDIGMLYLDPRLLDDQADQHFDGGAWTQVQTHVVLSYRILDVLGLPSGVKNAVLCHHERIDSTGYPRALWGRDVPFLGQLVGFCDIASTLRVKRFFGSGRNLRDALTVLQLNMDSFDPKIGQAFSAILTRGRLRATAFCPHDRDTMLGILKRRASVIRASMLQLEEVAEDRRTRHRSPKGHVLRGSLDRMLSNLRRSGHSDQDFVWWLGLVAAGKEKADMHQLAEIDLQQEELMWQLRRVRQELFKAVPSLGIQRRTVAI